MGVLSPLGESLSWESSIAWLYAVGQQWATLNGHLAMNRCALITTFVQTSVWTVWLQALGQCRGFLSMNLPNVVQVRTSSTASAAEQLLELLKAGDPSARHSAAICSRVCADLHEELEVLQSGIQDGESAWIVLNFIRLDSCVFLIVNFTRYIVLSKAPLLLQPRSATLQRALLRCVLPLGRDAPVSLTPVFRLFPEDIQVMRVDRRPALSGTPFHDCVFLEVECSPLISCNTDIGQLWRDKLAAAVEAINARIGLPCCHILGAW